MSYLVEARLKKSLTSSRTHGSKFNLLKTFLYRTIVFRLVSIAWLSRGSLSVVLKTNINWKFLWSFTPTRGGLEPTTPLPSAWKCGLIAPRFGVRLATEFWLVKLTACLLWLVRTWWWCLLTERKTKTKTGVDLTSLYWANLPTTLDTRTET